MRPLTVCLAVVFVGAVARPAYAQGDYVNLGVGVSFGSADAQARPNLVGDVGFLPRQPVGIELDVDYAPRFFSNAGGFTENRLTTVMGNVIIAGFERDRGRRRREVLRPYVTGGFGLMSEHIGPNGFSDDHLGLDVGVGVMVLSRRQLGVRADLRYFQDLVGSGTNSGIDFGSFHFVRASIGLVAAFR
jgi:hypothetical protein